MTFFNRLFKFRIFKFRTTLTEELDDLHTESNRLQQNINRTRLLQRTWTKWFAIYAILFYLSANLIYYTLFLPNDYVTQIYAFGISIATGTLFYVVHSLLGWYFRKSLQIKEERLTVFKERRQELIEEVKNKETYAVAKSLLEKYGETIATPDFRPPVTNGTSKGNSVKLNGNSAEKPPAVSIVSSPSPVVLEHQTQTPVRGGPTRLAAGVTPGKLPRAILPPQRTFWGAMLDTIVGDGPSKRYALICKSCNSHNGMALEEEFEYLSFRCAYCNYFNGARKQKPVFNPEVFHSLNERRDAPTVTDSSDSTEETRLTRRSIRIPPPPPPPSAKTTNGTRSRSPSTSREQRRSDLSSSEENLSKERKTK